MRSRVLIGIILVATFSAAPTNSWHSARATQSTPAEIAKLIDDCGLETTVMANRLFNFSFNQTATEEALNKTDQLKSSESKVYEVYPTAIGRRVRLIYVQIAENGAPLSGKKARSTNSNICAKLPVNSKCRALNSG